MSEWFGIQFKHQPHPHIEERKKTGPPKTNDNRVGVNGKIGLFITMIVGTMWAAYIFTVISLVSLPSAISSKSILTIISWIAQTFLQLVLLPVIIVGQNLQGRASDKRAEMTYNDADATFHEASQIQEHLKAQDDAINAMMDKLLALESAITKNSG